MTGRKDDNVLFNDAFNTFHLRLYGVGHMVKDHSAKEENHFSHYKCYSFRLAARVLLYAPSHRQDSTLRLNGSTMRDRSNAPP